MNNAEQQFLNDLDKRLRTAADKLRANLNPSDYMHVVLGLVFLKYVSDPFMERREELQGAFADPANTEKNIFWVPALARWDFLKASAKVAIGTQLKVRNGKTTQYKFNGIGRDPARPIRRKRPAGSRDSQEPGGARL